MRPRHQSPISKSTSSLPPVSPVNLSSPKKRRSKTKRPFETPTSNALSEPLNYGSNYYRFVPKKSRPNASSARNRTLMSVSSSVCEPSAIWCFSMDANMGSEEIDGMAEMPVSLFDDLEAFTEDKYQPDIWFQEYMEQKNKSASIYKFALEQLQQLPHMAIPRRVRCAVICDLLHSIIAAEDGVMVESAVKRIPGTPYLSSTFWKRRWTRISPIFNRLMAELFRVCYLDIFDNDVGFDTKRFFTSRPYFECVELLKKEVCFRRDRAQQTAMSNCLKVLKSRLGHMCQQSVKSMFIAWRAHTRKMGKLRNSTAVLLGDKCLRLVVIRMFTAWRLYVRRLKEDQVMADMAEHDALVKAKTKEIKSLTQAKTKIQIQFNDQISDLEEQVKQLQAEILAREELIETRKLQTNVQNKKANLEKNINKLKEMLAEKPLSLDLLMSSEAVCSGSSYADLPFGDVPHATIVIRWANYQIVSRKLHIKYLEGKIAMDLKHDWMDGKRLLVLFKALGYPVSENDFKKRNTLKLAIKRSLEFKINPGPMLTFFDVSNGRSDIVFVFLTHLMKKHPNLVLETKHLENKFLKYQSAITSFETMPDSEDHEALMKHEKVLIKLAGECEELVEHTRDREHDVVKLISDLQARANEFCVARKNGLPLNPLDDASVKEQNEYTKLMWLKLKNLLLIRTHNDKETAKEHVRTMQDVLRKFYYHLKTAFVYYAGRGGGASTMDASEFQVFVSDIRIKDKRISSKSLRGLFVLVNMEPDEMQEANSRPVTREAEPVGGDEDEEELFNPDDELVPSEYVELLARIALDKYPSLEPPAALQKLIEEHVLRYSAVNSDYLREYIASDDFKRVMKRLGSKLHAIFEFYSRMNARCRDVDKDELFLSSREFLRLLDDAGTSKVVNPTRARLIFRRAQSADDEDDGDANEDALEFEEFLEAISVIALHQNADPYLPIATRIEEYLMDLVANNTKIF